MKNNAIERVKVAMGRAHATISDACQCGIDRRFFQKPPFSTTSDRKCGRAHHKQLYEESLHHTLKVK